jgi:hypothetical protein
VLHRRPVASAEGELILHHTRGARCHSLHAWRPHSRMHGGLTATCSCGAVHDHSAWLAPAASTTNARGSGVAGWPQARHCQQRRAVGGVLDAATRAAAASSTHAAARSGGARTACICRAMQLAVWRVARRHSCLAALAPFAALAGASASCASAAAHASRRPARENCRAT